MKLPHVLNDGGRYETGYRGKAGDCVTRSIAIATGLPYKKVYEEIRQHCRAERRTKKGRSHVAGGVFVGRKWFKDYMRSLGFVWYPTMAMGTGCRVHLAEGELPMGRLVVSCSQHYTAVIDGVVNDTHDPTRDGTRCVYGYWRLEG